MVATEDDGTFFGNIVLAHDRDIPEELMQTKVHEAAPKVEHAAFTGWHLDSHIFVIHGHLVLRLGRVFVLDNLLAVLGLFDALALKIHKRDAAVIFFV